MSFDVLENKLLKAKVGLMMKSVFISTISLNIKHKISTEVETAATNGLTIWYNPDFIKDMTIPKLTGLIAHECWHIAFQHLFRKQERDPFLWNVAGDIVINNMLKQSGFTLPDGALLDQKYLENTTEQVYDDLLQENKNFQLNIVDLSGTPEELPPEEQVQIKGIIIKAATQAKLTDNNIGNLPTEILREIEKILNPTLPWESLLYNFVNERAKDNYSWLRRNRRYSEIYLPSLYNPALSHITFAIDTSGSISDTEMQQIVSEIITIQKVFNPTRMTILTCDCKLHDIHECDKHTNIASLSFTGGGGTDFLPVFKHIEDNPTEALIYFTDLYGEFTKIKNIPYPVLWICNSSHKPAPIGQTIYMDIDNYF